jgi:isoleucyl-tRNA synthetase
VAEEGDLLVALDTEIDAELADEGLAREVAHRLQNLRKQAGYEISDRIAAAVCGDPASIDRLAPHRDWLAEETLATSLVLASDGTLPEADRSELLTLDGAELHLAVRRVAPPPEGIA